MRPNTKRRKRAAARRTVTKCMAALLAATVLSTGCGSSAPGSARPSAPGSARPSAHQPAGQATGTIPRWLLAQARTIGRGPRFHPPATGPVLGPCRRALGARVQAHVELFADNHVVLVGSGIGTRPPRALSAGRIVAARCYGAIVTLDPTGVVLVARGASSTLADLFRSWGQPLSSSRLAGFRAAPGTHVAVFIDGRAWHGAPATVPLTEHAEIVLEVGPHVPPHRFYTFPPLP